MSDYNKAIPRIPFVPNRLPVGEISGEPMVYLDDEFVCDSMYYHWVEDEGRAVPGSSASIMARETVCKMLHDAESKLPAGLKFKIYDAYRPIAVQQALYDHFRAQKREENPGISEEDLDAVTALCVSFPSYNIMLPSLHNSGGAVDLTIIDEDGNELNMGCGFDEFTDRAWVDYYELIKAGDIDPKTGEPTTQEQIDECAKNRRLLYNVMIEAGFTNFPSEWWHYDFGDEKWGQFSNNVPIYTGNLDAGLRNAVPYEHQDLVQKANAEQLKKAAEIIALRADCRELDAEVAKVARGY